MYICNHNNLNIRLLFQRCKARLRWKAAAILPQIRMLQETRACEQSKQKNKSQRKLTFILLTMTFSFYLTWTPYAANSFLSMIGILTPKLIQILAILFAKSGTVINPILYIFFNKEVSFIYKTMHKR